MSKGLEYIRDISYLILENYSDKEPLTEEQKLSKNCFLDYSKYIEKELQRLEAIDNANPSEALDKVNKLLESCYEYEKKTGKNAIVHISKEPLIEIQQALIKAQEQNKKLKSNLARWLELLQADGINSKNMVATDIQQLLEEIDK